MPKIIVDLESNEKGCGKCHLRGEGEVWCYLYSRIIESGEDDELRLPACLAAEQEYKRLEGMAWAKFFIDHIHAHLKDGEAVICKICGRTAQEIIEEARHG